MATQGFAIIRTGKKQESMAKSDLPSSNRLLKASPLWERAPARDKKGQPYSDFIMLIPSFKNDLETVRQAKRLILHRLLQEYQHVIVYVDLNEKLGLLWISIKPVPGVIRVISHRIQQELTDARIISGDAALEENHKGKTWPRLVQWVKETIPGRLLLSERKKNDK